MLKQTVNSNHYDLKGLIPRKETRLISSNNNILNRTGKGLKRMTTN
jgi:hypothetical protein